MAEDDIVLGIDLGTTFSAMAYVNRYGKPEILANAEGKPTTPSVVHFYDHDGVVVGEEAVKMVVIDPEFVVRFIKRNMGEEDFTLEFFDTTYTPQEISALILRKLKEDAEELLGTPISDAVITVPAYFNSAQRGATSEAGAIAGLNVLSIINEPTAAAICYGIDKIGGKRKLLVFDLGGGTFDVTIMEIRGTKLTTLASDGNAELGGKDWDDVLLNHVAEQFFAKHQLDPRDEASPYQELYERCLQAKISLSTKSRAVIPINFHGQRMVVQVTREQFEELSHHLVQQCADTCQIVLEKAKLSWSDLDEVLLVGGSTRMPMIRQLLRDLSGSDPCLDLNPDESVAHGAALAGVFRHRPNHIALRNKREAMTKRAQALKQQEAKQRKAAPTPKKKPSGAVIGLAEGGHRALQANALGKEPPEPEDDAYTPGTISKSIEIQDATTHPLGIVVLDHDRQERIVELIPENTLLPYEYRGRFAYAYDDMRSVRVEITEGHGSYRDEVAVIGKVELRDLPPRPRGTPIEVIYQYGIDQMLSVRVVDVETGISKDARIHLSGGLSSSQLSDARGRNQRMSVE